MSGHSHWAGIKHKKALIDAKRGKEWSKVAKSEHCHPVLGVGIHPSVLKMTWERL